MSLGNPSTTNYSKFDLFFLQGPLLFKKSFAMPVTPYCCNRLIINPLSDQPSVSRNRKGYTQQVA